MLVIHQPQESAPRELMAEIWFYKFIDPYDNYHSEPVLLKFRAYKATPKGYWIVPEHDFHTTVRRVLEDWVRTDNKRWIARENEGVTLKKRFAYRQEEEALYSYYRRKLEHLRHLERKHDQLKQIIRQIERRQGFFGRERPMSTMMDFPTHMKPLEVERLPKIFLDEGEFKL